MTLRDRGVIVTGASRGLGLAIAEACVDMGAHVVVCGRDEAALDEACRRLVDRAGAVDGADGGGGRVVEAVAADVSTHEGAQRVAAAAFDRLPAVHGLVNNAGIYGPIGRLEDTDWDHWVEAVHVNLLSVTLMCRALLPSFRARGYGKIVNLSGGGATAPLPRFSAYAATKAAVVRLTETLAHETADGGIDVNAVAPGAMNTQLLDQVLAAGPEAAGADFHRRALEQKANGGTPLDKGAQLCAFLLSGASDGITGRLLSAVWDPWDTLPARRDELARSDVYTLRRIVPSDRGLDWDDG